MQDVILDPLITFHCPHCGEDLLHLAPEPFTTLPCPACRSEIAVPGQFGQFLLRQRLADSVISSVFEAHDPKLDRTVSLKILNYVLSKNSELAEAFKREALAAASLNSPHVLKVYEFGTHNGQPYMVMENTEGHYLNDLMRDRHLSDFRILSIIDGIVQGLMDTHEQGIVHGDVMPRNILIDPEGTPKICDFGLARFSGQDASFMDTWSSPYYMPPERIQGRPEDHRGDFYSLGTTLYYMMTDHLPFFDLEEETVLRRKCSEDPPDPRVYRADLHPELCGLVLKLLQREPQRRPADYSELQDLIRHALSQLPRGQDTAGRSSPPTRPLQKAVLPRKQPPWGVILLLSLGVVGALLIAQLSKQREPPVPLATPTPPPPPRPSATPAPAPTPGPAPTALPAPTAPPMASPTTPPPATPIVRAPPAVPLYQAIPVNVLQDASGAVEEWRDRVTGARIFQQTEPALRPRLVNAAFGERPGLQFDASTLFSSLTPQTEETFTLLLLLWPAANEGDPPLQFLAGTDPAAAGKHIAILLDKQVEGGIRFETDRGTALLVLSREERQKAFVVALVRDENGDRAHAGTLQSPLTGSPSARPPPDPQALPTLQLGGSGESPSYRGLLGEFRYYRQALSPEALLELFQDLKHRYGVFP